MNARDLFQQGATVSEAAAETGTRHAIAAYICRPMAPRWPTLSPDLIDRLPEHLQRQIKASNPNHRATP